jgi:hypothetical protein
MPKDLCGSCIIKMRKMISRVPIPMVPSECWSKRNPLALLVTRRDKSPGGRIIDTLPHDFNNGTLLSRPV